jgi:hypothetical protein
MADAAQLVLYHKQRSSARLRFLRHAHGGMCTLRPLPVDARVQTGPCDGTSEAVRLHPGMLLRAAEATLALPRGCIASDATFRCSVLADAGCADVYLGQFTDIDPPLHAVAAAGGSFIELVQARRLPRSELMLLRLVYEHVLG